MINFNKLPEKQEEVIKKIDPIEKEYTDEQWANLSEDRKQKIINKENEFKNFTAKQRRMKKFHERGLSEEEIEQEISDTYFLAYPKQKERSIKEGIIDSNGKLLKFQK